MPQIRTSFNELFWGKLDTTLVLPNGGPEVAWEHSACEEGRTLLRGQLARLKQRTESQYHQQSGLETGHGKAAWPKSKVVCSEKWQLNNYRPNHTKVSVWLLGYLCHYGNKQELRKPHGSVVTPSTETKPLCSHILPGNSPGTTGKASAILYSAKPHSSNSQTPDDSQDLPQTILTRQQCPPALHSLPQLYKFLIPFGKVT